MRHCIAFAGGDEGWVIYPISFPFPDSSSGGGGGVVGDGIPCVALETKEEHRVGGIAGRGGGGGWRGGKGGVQVGEGEEGRAMGDGEG